MALPVRYVCSDAFARYDLAIVDAFYTQANGSPRSASGTGAVTRKPTGPRPITGSGSYSPDKVARQQRYRGSPNQAAKGGDVTF